MLSASLRRRALVLGLCGLGLCARPALAGTTRSFSLNTYKDFEEGEATGVLLSSLGEAQSGYSAARLELGEALVYSSATGPDGTIYLGTGDQGQVYRYQQGKLHRLAKLDAVLVASLAVSKAGVVFAGTMPGGRVYAITPDGKARQLADLDAEHVWALVYDEGRKILYAATGPRGRLFAIDASHLERQGARRDRLVYDSGEKHLLSLLPGPNGSLLAGSADQAILYQITPTASGATVRARYDFPGDELRAIARHGDTLYVAVNAFTQANNDAKSGGAGGGFQRERKGKGALYRLDPDGRVEQLHALTDGYFTALHVDHSGSVWAASGSKGRVYLIRPDRTVVTAFDLPERQVLTLAFSPGANGPNGLLGTGDAGAIYRLSSSPPKDAHYLTRVLDAQFPSRWGAVRWSGSGVTMQTRSGNTARPDKTWSGWTAPASTRHLPHGAEGHVASPAGRYLQVRAGFDSPQSLLRGLTVYYQPQNQRPLVTTITVGDEGDAAAASKKPRTPVLKLHWQVENPDHDELVYRVYFRLEGEHNWKPLGGPEPLTATEYDWNTESVPDGNYQVQIVASDERSNPRPEALTHALTSAPFLIDNRKPEVAELRVNYPHVSGRAHDSFSTITALSYSIDGGEWQPLAPRDGIFDDSDEPFALLLPDKLTTGMHSLAVRAVDAADNVGATQTSFRVSERRSPGVAAR